MLNSKKCKMMRGNIRNWKYSKEYLMIFAKNSIIVEESMFEHLKYTRELRFLVKKYMSTGRM